MKYSANFLANNNTRFMTPIQSNNKNKLIRDIRSIAAGNRFQGSQASWCVFETDSGRPIAEGVITDRGYRRTPEIEI